MTGRLSFGLPAVRIFLVVPAGVLLLAFVVQLWPTLHQPWVDSFTYSHGYLVLGLAAWLAVRETRKRRIVLSSWSLVGLVVLAAVLLMAVAGRAADIVLAQQVALPLIPFGGLWLMGGWQAARRSIVPCGYMIFAIPIWDAINEPLRMMTTAVVASWVRAVSIPAFIEDNFIHVPSGTFEVAGGCSGLHYLIVACALAALFGVLNLERASLRLWLLGSAAMLALLSNWVRVFLLVVIGHVSEMQHYLMTDHYLFGWALFLLGVAPLWVIGRWLLKFDIVREKHVREEIGSHSNDPAVGRAVAVAALAVLLVANWGSHRVAAPTSTSAASMSLSLPPMENWEYDGSWDDRRHPLFLGADVEVSAWYRRHGGDRVGVYLAGYAEQRQGHEAVYYANRPEGNAEVLSQRSIVMEGGRAAFTELEVSDSPRERRLVWFRFQVAGRPASGSLQAKMLQILGAFGGRRDARVVVLTAACLEQCERARSTLGAFVSSSGVALALDRPLERS